MPNVVHSNISCNTDVNSLNFENSQLNKQENLLEIHSVSTEDPTTPRLNADSPVSTSECVNILSQLLQQNSQQTSIFESLWYGLKEFYQNLNVRILFKIPIFIVILLLLIIDGCMYALVRFISRLIEKYMTRPSVSRVVNHMNHADDYESYSYCAEMLDGMTGRNSWKEDFYNPPLSTYDPVTLERRISQLRIYQNDKNYEALYNCLKLCVETQLHNTLHNSLYSMTYSGTKYKITEFHEQIISSIQFLTNAVEQNFIPSKSLLAVQLSNLSKYYGLTAVVFSGGAMLGLHHLGVLEVLVEMELLPKVISGTSAGSVIAAYACTRTNIELLDGLRDPEQHDLFRAPFNPNNCFLRLINFVRYGYTVDRETWLSLCNKLFHEITFLEAYKKTGRMLNITMSRADDIESSCVLNYRNAPNVLILTAVLASSAFPYLGFPTQLLEKDPKTGYVQKSQEHFQCLYRDGSLHVDVPCTYLYMDCGVKYTIVSQVNPHVFPFLDFKTQGSPGQPIRGWGSHAAWKGGYTLAVLRLTLREHLRFLLRLVALLEVVPAINGISISRVALQNYVGDLNICPPRLSFPHLWFMNNISRSMMKWYMRIGRQMTFPKIPVIKARVDVEKALVALNKVIYKKSQMSYQDQLDIE